MKDTCRPRHTGPYLRTVAMALCGLLIWQSGALAQHTGHGSPPSAPTVPPAPATSPHAEHGAAPTASPATPAGSPVGGHGGHDMRPLDAAAAPVIPLDRRGGQPLAPRVIDGVKEFALTVGVVQWHILPEVKVAALAYNGVVPGPTIRVAPRDRLRIDVRNESPEPTTIHWHGLILPNEQDGVPEVTQPPIPPGGRFTYSFEVPDTPGTYFYHTHYAADRQQSLGLYGAFIIEGGPPVPAEHEYVVQLNELRVEARGTLPAMEFDGGLPNYFTINGKSYPATDTVRVKVGERVLFRFVGSGQFIHPMHIHGGPFEIVATDGYPVPPGARLKKDTVLVGPGERYDVVWTALKPGKWLLHCHINHHLTNDGAEVAGGGGLTMVIEVTG